MWLRRDEPVTLAEWREATWADSQKQAFETKAMETYKYIIYKDSLIRLGYE